MSKQKKTVAYTKKQKILEVMGKEYEIPARTAILEKRIKDWDENIRPDATEYESLCVIFDILFGKDKAQELVGDEETCDLDFLTEVYERAAELYFLEKNLLTKKKLEDALRETSSLLPTIDGIEKARKIIEA